ncbi:MAG TPA: sugar phosphate isomerase/epimerase family protein [Limnochordia bacterium]|nr:sugar phosphate isomerase/epimerase family protein [Limnochordia bacterium]
MARPVTLFTGQWADLPLAELLPKIKSFGYDGAELACWGDHFDVEKGAADKAYCDERRALLQKHGLGCWAISNHLTGQLVLDPTDHRTDAWVPASVAGNPQAKREWAIDQMKKSAKAAKNFGVGVVPGFTGSGIWHFIYPFPPVSDEDIKKGYDEFAQVWGPILDEFKNQGVKFALEVHPTEIAFDLYSFEMALKAVGNHPAFGINFDPSHLIWQGLEAEELIYAFPDRIFHVHVKDAAVQLNGRSGILASHLQFGDPRRGWDFRSPGRGDVKFEEIIRALNFIGYDGPLSVEWEDNAMEREHGAAEAAAFVKELDFKRPAGGSFEGAFKKE